MLEKLLPIPICLKKEKTSAHTFETDFSEYVPRFYKISDGSKHKIKIFSIIQKIRHRQAASAQSPSSSPSRKNYTSLNTEYS